MSERERLIAALEWCMGWSPWCKQCPGYDGGEIPEEMAKCPVLLRVIDMLKMDGRLEDDLK